MPSTYTNIYGNAGLIPVFDHNMKAEQQRIKCGVSLTLVKGTVMGQITATGLWIAYLTGASDGSQIPKCVLAYDVVTDASGNHSIGGAQQGVTYLDVPAYFSGDFNCADLTGLDAGGVTAGKWNLLWGSITTGVVRLPA